MTTAGLSIEEAKTDVCQAIADGTIKIRVKPREHTTKHFTSKSVLAGKDVQIPTNIKADDLDWEKSRPVKPWLVPHGSHRPHGYWNLEWIELSRTDVTNVFCPAKTVSQTVQPASSRQNAKGRSKPALERAKRVIQQLYPHGVPEQAVEPNKVLCRHVSEELKKRGLAEVSPETILRAADRRRK